MVIWRVYGNFPFLDLLVAFMLILMEYVVIWVSVLNDQHEDFINKIRAESCLDDFVNDSIVT